MQPVAKSFSINHGTHNVPKPYTAIGFDFPKELILLIFKHLNSYDLVQAGRTCKRLHTLSMDASLDLAQFATFSQMGTKRIPCKVTSNPGFLLHGNFVFHQEVNIFDDKLIQVNSLTQERICLSPPMAKFYHMVQSNNYFYLLYYYDNDSNWFLKIIPKERTLGEEVIFNSAELSGNLDGPVLDSKVINDRNMIIISINKHVLCFKGTEFILDIAPPKVLSESFVNISVYEAFLLINYTVCKDLTQHLYHLDKLKLISKRTTRCDPPFSARFTRSQITNQMIINYDYTNQLLSLELLDFNLNLVNLLNVNLSYFNLIQYRYIEIKPNLNFHFYENKMCILREGKKLLFYDLGKARVLKKYDIENTTWLRQQSCALEDKVVLARKKSIVVFDMHTGNIRKKFVTRHTPTWVDFGKNNDGYFLNYEAYNEETSKTHYQHMVVKKTKVSLARKRKR